MGEAEGRDRTELPESRKRETESREKGRHRERTMVGGAQVRGGMAREGGQSPAEERVRPCPSFIPITINDTFPRSHLSQQLKKHLCS